MFLSFGSNSAWPWRCAALLLAGSTAAQLTALEPPTPVQERAIERLDAIGVERTGQLFVRMVTATHQPMIDLFLDSGIDINAVGNKGRSALLAAILVRDWATAERLIAAGADPQRADENGFTPLMGAALRGHLPTVRALLAHGAAVSTADHTGHTALHYAIASRQREIIDCFLQGNGPLPGLCGDGKDLLTHALETHDRQVIDPILTRSSQLAQWSAEACGALAAALDGGDVELSRQLIAKHTVPPVPAENAQPSLAYAIARGDLARLGLLLDCGVDPNAPLLQAPDPVFKPLIGANFLRYYLEKEPGITPLMLAAGLGRVDCVRTLLARGADRRLASRSRAELLPLYFAAWAECPEAVQMLLGPEAPSRAQLRVNVDLKQQRATLYQNGVATFSTEISSGKSGKATPAGEFVITDKHLDHHSSIYQNASMPFFMRLSCRDFGMHQGYVTGRPASHGCIRLPAAAARKFYKELPIGTWVSVTR